MPNNQGCSSGRRWFGTAVFALVFLLLILLLSPAGAQDDRGVWQAQLQAMPRSLTYTFSTPTYQIASSADGFSTIEMAGFYPAGLPGDPQLPAALYTIALPPLVPLDSLAVEIAAVEQQDLPGTYRIPPVGPLLPAADGLPEGADWGPHAAAIVDGKNALVYAADAYYPEKPVDLMAVAHMRKWRLAKLRYWPLSYNPVTGQLRLTTKVTVTLKYAAPLMSSEAVGELQDILADDRARLICLNFAEAQPWYDSMILNRAEAEQAKPGYAIITTNQIVAASSALETFVSHKEAEGYDVQVVTEDTYGPLTGPPPNRRADKVRQWLGDHWKSDDLLYVLLIGNPDPYDPDTDGDTAGDMPMKIMKKIGNEPTDFYFADLYSTDPENWDWEAELYVGRIPVYQSDENWAGLLDSILLKTINYETSSDVAWRRSALLPMAFLDVGYDGADLAELMKTDYLEGAGFSTHRLYWHGVLSNSQYSSEEELVDGAVHDRWQSQPFGIVALYAHGFARGMAIYDETSNSGRGMGGVLESLEIGDLDDNHPAFTFQASCSTGYPEDSNNLGYTLLKNGGVATVSGSRTTYGWPDQPPGPDAHNISLTYNYVKHIVENMPAGKALYWVKSTPGGEIANALAYNLYGDPSIQLQAPASSADEGQAGAGQAAGSSVSDPQAVQNANKLAPGSLPLIPGSEIGVTGAQIEGTRNLNNFPESMPGQILNNEPDGLISMGQIHNCAVKPNGDIDCLGDRWGNTDTYDQAADQTGPYLQISAGLKHSCGLKPDGSVHCWGKGDFDLTLDRAGPYTQISTQDQHVCALTVEGDIDCWGNNDAGQAAGRAGPFIQVSTGTNYNCGLKADGSVECWAGDNDWGEVEDQAGPFTQITSGGDHNCAIKPNGTLFCWGSNQYNQTNYPAGSFVQISAGLDHTCGLTRAGAVKCWGRNQHGQVENRTGPYTQVSAGRYHSCALGEDGLAECWGLNENDQASSWNGPFTQIAGGVYHTCGLAPNGTVYCWGNNEYGEADGQGLTAKYKRVSAGLYHTCGLKADGGVHCWGRQDNDLDLDPPGPYIQISTNYLHVCGLEAGGNIDCWGNNDAGQAKDQYGSFVQVSTGMQHSCGLKGDGAVDCWGRNSFGQANDRSGPFVQIDAGYFHTCGLKPDGSVDCWGANHHGQAEDQAGPFIQISTGWLNTCALRPDGSVHCWGKNESGQTEDRPGPYVRVSTNRSHTAGLKADGTIDFWGGWMMAEEQPGPYGSYQPESKRMSYTAQQYSDGGYYTAVHLADMDGDNHPELLIGNRDTNELEIWRYNDNAGTLAWIDAIEFPFQIHDIKTADFDRDRDMDIVVGLRSYGLYYAQNTGAPGTVGSWDIQLLDQSYSWQVLVADFDKDGKLDIFQGIDYGPINTFYGDGKGSFTTGTAVQNADTAMRFASGFNAIDVDGDGRLDLIGTDGSFLRAFINPGNRSDDWRSAGQYMPTANYPCCEPTALQSNLSPSAGDLDGDGAIDQVAFLGTPGSAGPVHLLLFKGDKYLNDVTWETKLLDTILYPGYAGHAGVADLDGDNILDIHVGGWSRFNNLLVYFGNRRGDFTAETITLNHGVGEFNSIASGDINGDGVMDFVTNRYTSDKDQASGFEVLYGTRLLKYMYLPVVK